jgi:hypothetical protein
MSKPREIEQRKNFFGGFSSTRSWCAGVCVVLKMWWGLEQAAAMGQASLAKLSSGIAPRCQNDEKSHNPNDDKVRIQYTCRDSTTTVPVAELE